MNDQIEEKSNIENNSTADYMFILDADISTLQNIPNKEEFYTAYAKALDLYLLGGNYLIFAYLLD